MDGQANRLLDDYGNGIRRFRLRSNSGNILVLDGVNLEEADFSGSFLLASFRNCNLRGASFKNANVKTCDFTGANLINADFRNAALCSTTFIDANMEGADFKDSFFHGHDLKAGEVPHW
jgi:uncharacterized protein YjbI with pentapeptide repeats